LRKYTRLRLSSICVRYDIVVVGVEIVSTCVVGIVVPFHPKSKIEKIMFIIFRRADAPIPRHHRPGNTRG
jgi:hypothetical protein